MDSDGLLTIEGEGDFAYESVGIFVYDAEGNEYFSRFVKAPWKDYNNIIKTVRMKVSGVKSLQEIFGGGTTITPDGEVIYKKAPPITSIDCSGSDFSDVISAAFMCKDCTELTVVNMSGVKFGNLYDASSMFAGCNNLVSIDATDWDFANTTTAVCMFDQCKKLNTIHGIENWNMSNCRDLTCIFADCMSLKTLDLSSWNISSKCNYVSNLFSGCTVLENVVGLEKWDFSNVYDLYYCFSECESIKKLNLTNWCISSKCNDLSGVFYKCSSLTEIKGIENWDYSGVEVSNTRQIFYGCNKLKKLVLPGSINGFINDSFSGCNKLNLYYVGTRNEWNNLNFNQREVEVCVAKIHYGYGTCNHSYKTISIQSNGYKYYMRQCSICGDEIDIDSSNVIALVRVEKKSLTYNGMAQTPNVKVYNKQGEKISSNYYSVTYKNNKNIGKATIYVNANNDTLYAGSAKATFNIVPKNTKISSVKAKNNKQIIIKWKKNTTATGYQVQVATDKKFNKVVKLSNVSKKNIVYTIINKKKKKKNYYVRIRVYKIVNGKKFYSKWDNYKKTVRLKH